MQTQIADSPFTEELLNEIRSQFWFVESDPASGERIWLDGASGSLRLKAMVEALADRTMYADQFHRENPGSHIADEVLATGIQNVRTFMGAKSGSIMPAISSTHAIYRAVNAILASSPGKNVVTTDLEHASMYDSTHQLAEQYDKEWRVAQLDPQTGFVPIEEILRKVDKQTSLIGMVHASNMTGAIHDIQTIAREAKKINPDIFIVVDGVQYAPHATVDVEELGVDAYIFGPYKVFCAKGIAFAYLSDRAATLGHWRLHGKAAGDWALGSPEDATYAAWSAVTDYLYSVGQHFTDSADRRARIVAAMDASRTHLSALLRRALDGAGQLKGLRDLPNVELHGLTGNMDDRICLGLFSFKSMSGAEAVSKYNQSGIRLSSRKQDAYAKHTLEALGIPEAIRLSACHYNTPQEIDRFLEVTASLS